VKKFQRSFSVASILLFILLLQIAKAIDIGYSNDLLSYLNKTIQNPSQYPCIISNFSSEGRVCVILFYGATCPHCAQERDFWKNILSNQQFSKNLKLIELEVYYNQTNQKLFLDTAKKFNISENQLGVPFTIIGDKAFLGFAYSQNSGVSSPPTSSSFSLVFLALIFVAAVLIIFILLKRWKSAR
jgi:thioredoxin-related protein